MTKSDILNNITIAFAGYNIKDFAVLAIESFLLLNPDMRKNIVYFDDESTDGTREELESRGIRVITWLPEITEKRNKYDEEVKRLISYPKKTTPERVSFINKCIRKQINTRFLYISDADVIFVRNYFIKIIEMYLNSDVDIVCPILNYDCMVDETDDKFVISSYRKYLKNKKDKKIITFYSENGETKAFVKRIYLNQILVDLDKFEKKCSFEDDISCDLYSFFDDTGTSLYEKAILNKIKILDLKENILLFNENKDIIHIRWVSSSIREQRKKETKGSHEEEMAIQNMQTILNKKELKPIFENIRIDFFEILEIYKKNIENL